MLAGTLARGEDALNGIGRREGRHLQLHPPRPRPSTVPARRQQPRDAGVQIYLDIMACRSFASSPTYRSSSAYKPITAFVASGASRHAREEVDCARAGRRRLAPATTSSCSSSRIVGDRRLVGKGRRHLARLVAEASDDHRAAGGRRTIRSEPPRRIPTTAAAVEGGAGAGQDRQGEVGVRGAQVRRFATTVSAYIDRTSSVARAPPRTHARTFVRTRNSGCTHRTSMSGPRRRQENDVLDDRVRRPQRVQGQADRLADLRRHLHSRRPCGQLGRARLKHPEQLDIRTSATCWRRS